MTVFLFRYRVGSRLDDTHYYREEYYTGTYAGAEKKKQALTNLGFGNVIFRAC